MLKFEWPLLLPNDKNIKKLSTNVMDIDEYIVDIANTKALQRVYKKLMVVLLFIMRVMLELKIWVIKLGIC